MTESTTTPRSSDVPVSTYRLQLTPEFTLREAAATADYLAALGADWVYLSPILTAEAGSQHGYDVTDHSHVDSPRGGREGLVELSAAARDNALGVLVDIVPNHVGVATPEQNPWWWDLLAHGRDSRYAEAFDVDWEAGGGRIRIPVLGETDDPPLSIVDGRLAYYDHRFPIAPGTADDGADAHTVHSRQHYELVHWTRADSELNYRRFFAVNTLAAVRVEVPWVFDESHAQIVGWIRDGLVDGLRVDHPDGLADPTGYLERLAEVTGGAYVLVEKILESGESLPSHWRTAGTTGYDALAIIDRVLIDPEGQRALDQLDTALRGAPVDWHELIHETKRGIADGILRSEVLRLARGVPEIERADDALAELLACFPVYRSYLPLGVEHLRHAIDLAVRHRPDLADAIERLRPVLSDPAHPVARRFQQTSGMVMAKGVEDTAFYRYSRLVSLTEVGGDPAEFAIAVDEFHRRQAVRHAALPASMTTLSTHDTKRGEDTRARIDVLSEVPELWVAMLDTLRERAPIGDGPFENLLWSSLIGAWPISRERAHAYAEKAAREAGVSTTWTAPDEGFESRMHAAIDTAFDDAELAANIERFVDDVSPAGWSNSLSAKVLQLAGPGAPDVYQGSELWETSLVDPDNRRPVDFELRRRLLAELDDGVLPPIDASGAAKLLVTSRSLRLRRERPELFSRYTVIEAVGSAAHHVVAFDRGGAIAVATRLPIALAREGGWRDTAVLVPGPAVVDEFTGREFPGGAVPLAELLDPYPVALLTRKDAS